MTFVLTFTLIQNNLYEARFSDTEQVWWFWIFICKTNETSPVKIGPSLNFQGPLVTSSELELGNLSSGAPKDNYAHYYAR